VVVAAALTALGNRVSNPWLRGGIGIVLILMNLPGLAIFLPLRFTLFQDIAQWHEAWKIAAMLTTFLVSGVVWGWLVSICFEAMRRRRGVQRDPI